jgi:hypothetical protein
LVGKCVSHTSINIKILIPMLRNLQYAGSLKNLRMFWNSFRNEIIYVDIGLEIHSFRILKFFLIQSSSCHLTKNVSYVYQLLEHSPLFDAKFALEGDPNFLTYWVLSQSCQNLFSESLRVMHLQGIRRSTPKRDDQPTAYPTSSFAVSSVCDLMMHLTEDTLHIIFVVLSHKTDLTI